MLLFFSQMVHWSQLLLIVLLTRPVRWTSAQTDTTEEPSGNSGLSATNMIYLIIIPIAVIVCVVSAFVGGWYYRRYKRKSTLAKALRNASNYTESATGQTMEFRQLDGTAHTRESMSGAHFRPQPMAGGVQVVVTGPTNPPESPQSDAGLHDQKSDIATTIVEEDDSQSLSSHHDDHIHISKHTSKASDASMMSETPVPSDANNLRKGRVMSMPQKLSQIKLDLKRQETSALEEDLMGSDDDDMAGEDADNIAALQQQAIHRKGSDEDDKAALRGSGHEHVGSKDFDKLDIGQLELKDSQGSASLDEDDVDDTERPTRGRNQYGSDAARHIKGNKSIDGIDLEVEYLAQS